MLLERRFQEQLDVDMALVLLGTGMISKILCLSKAKNSNMDELKSG